MSRAALPHVVDCYETAAKKSPTYAALYHREAKRCCKQSCRAADLGMPTSTALLVRRAPGNLPTAPRDSARCVAGQMWAALGKQYQRLSELKGFNEHDNRRALRSFDAALERVDVRDRPDIYRGRLDAATQSLAHKRRLTWAGRKRRLEGTRTQAWEDAVMLLKIPAWSTASTSSWEGVAELSIACRDRASTKLLQRQILPLLKDAMRRKRHDWGHGNPWHAAVAVAGHHPKLAAPITSGMREAVAADAIAAHQLPMVLNAYDQVLVSDANFAIDAAADLETLRARFWNRAHDMGNLVFTAGRYLEAAQKLEARADGESALHAVAAVAECTPDIAARVAAVTMLGYVAKRLPDFGVQAVTILTTLALSLAASDAVSEAAPIPAALAAGIARALAGCREKPTARPVRQAAKMALLRLATLAEAPAHAA